ncbi:MAG: lipid-A-disaccharide synthase [Rickettsiaceae bacterium]
MIKIYIVAGEASGDFIGSRVMGHIKRQEQNCSFRGVGGPKMEKEDLKSLFPMDDINLMGFTEILPHIFKIKALINDTKKDIEQYQPDLLITIDSPGFTFRVASLVRKNNKQIKMLHIVAPSVWAYKPSRAKKYAAIYNYIFTLLSFEPQYFQRYGLESHYIGHPIFEQSFVSCKSTLRREMKIDKNKKIIAVAVGSRNGEIKIHTPIFVEALNMLSLKINDDLEIIFVILSESHEKLIKQYLKTARFRYRFSQDKLTSFALADVALAKSGTNTLEIAASKTPMVVAYKAHFISYMLIKAMISIEYASLINIAANKEIIPEYIQFKCKPALLSEALLQLICNKAYAQNQIKSVQTILKNNMGLKNTDSRSNTQFNYDSYLDPTQYASHLLLKYVKNNK